MKLTHYLLLILAPFFWSFNFVIGKTIVTIIPPHTLNILRWIIPITLFLFLTWKDLRINIPLYLANWPLLLLLGATGYFLNTVSVYYSVRYTTAINASLLASFSPAIFAVFSYIFYKDKISPLQGLGIIFSILGVFWIVFKGEIRGLMNLKPNIGDMLMLISVVSWAIHSLVFKRKVRALSSNSLFTLMMLSGVLLTLPFSLWENWQSNWSWLPQMDKHLFLSIVILNIFPSLLAFFLWNKALLEVSSNQAAIFLNFSPVFTTLMSVLFLGEHLMLYHFTGGILIFMGVILVTNGPVFVELLGKKKIKTEQLKP